MKKWVLQKIIFFIMLSAVFISSCSSQSKLDLPDIYALRRDGITYELIRITPPNYTIDSIAHYSVSSYDIAHNSEKIVYSTFLYGNESIVIVEANTGYQSNKSGNSFLRNPNFSPSDDLLVYEKREKIDSIPQIAVSDINFSNIRTLDPDVNAIFPSWSPDGKIISMLTSIDEGCPIDDPYYCKNVSLYSLDLKEITSVINGPINPDYPINWTREQGQILYSKWVQGRYHLFTFDIEGNNEKQLTDSDFNDVMGIWSDDGKQIAFTRKLKSIDQLCLLSMESTKCFDQSHYRITGISWINDTNIIYGAYDSKVDTTKIILWNILNLEKKELATYPGYIEDFKTFSKRN